METWCIVVFIKKITLIIIKCKVNQDCWIYQLIIYQKVIHYLLEFKRISQIMEYDILKLF